MNEESPIVLTLPSSSIVWKRAAPLIFILLLVLFPFGWLGHVWYPAGMLLWLIFPTAQAHAIGHALMFLGAGLALLMLFPPLRTRPLLYLGVMLSLSMGQELFQLVYKQRALAFDDVRDILVDLVAILLALALVKLWGLGKVLVRSTGDYDGTTHR